MHSKSHLITGNAIFFSPAHDVPPLNSLTVNEDFSATANFGEGELGRNPSVVGNVHLIAAATAASPPPGSV